MADRIDGIENIVFDSNNEERRSWIIFGKRIPRSEIVFLCQIVLIFFIVTFAVANLALTKTCEEATVWVAILSSSVGYMLPSPRV